MQPKRYKNYVCACGHPITKDAYREWYHLSTKRYCCDKDKKDRNDSNWTVAKPK